MTEVVHPERHLDTVVGPLGAGHHLDTGVAHDPCSGSNPAPRTRSTKASTEHRDARSVTSR